MELYTEPQHSPDSLQSTVTNTQPAFNVYNLPPGTRWVTSSQSPLQLSTRELFNNFHYIWAKLRGGEEECKDVEWKRRTQFVLEQLRPGDNLTRR